MILTNIAIVYNISKQMKLTTTLKSHPQNQPRNNAFKLKTLIQNAAQQS